MEETGTHYAQYCGASNDSATSAQRTVQALHSTHQELSVVYTPGPDLAGSCETISVLRQCWDDASGRNIFDRKGYKG